MTGGAQTAGGSTDAPASDIGGFGSPQSTGVTDSSQSDVKASCSCRTVGTRGTRSLFANGCALLLLSAFSLLQRKRTSRTA
jgi:hypothetical protein